MVKSKIDAYMGFGGVAPRENQRAITWGGRLEIPMLLISLWVLAEWYLAANNGLDVTTQRISDWLIWSFFLLETTVITLLCDDKYRHLLRNWANLAIIIFAFPLIYDQEQFGSLRIIRLFFLIGFFSHNFRIAKAVLAQNKLGKTLAISAVFITGGGILIAGIDPAIHTPADGIWWAWVTVTTVGYGDIVPSSGEGKIFASLLILLGICMVSLITANVSAYLLSRQGEKEIRYERQELKKLMELEQQMKQMETKLDKILSLKDDKQP